MGETRAASYDLHLHTYWSYDATAHPESYYKRARELGMRCIAITEHHVLDSVEEVLEIAAGYPEIRTIPSAELTVTTSIGAVDLLCYGFPLPIPDALRSVLDGYHVWQRSNGSAISRGLLALGHQFSDDDRLGLLERYRPRKAIRVQGNTHVKNEALRDYCIEHGFIEHEDGYRELLEKARREVSFPSYPHVDDVVPVVKAAGALVAIAHPHGYFNKGDVGRMDALRAECSLDGIECAHSMVPPEFTQRYRDYCIRHGLFSTGGSDCHSDRDIAESLARHGGAEEWLEELLDRLPSR